MDKNTASTLAQINIALACSAKVLLLFRKIQYFFVLWSKKPFHSHISRAPKESCALLSGGNVLKDRRQIYPCLKHYKPVSHGDSLNYESALDKFSSVCSFKGTPPPPLPQRNGVVVEGKNPQLKGARQLPLCTCILGGVSGCGD